MTNIKNDNLVYIIIIIIIIYTKYIYNILNLNSEIVIKSNGSIFDILQYIILTY